MKRAALLVLLLGCTQQQAVLSIVTEVTDCAEAFRAPPGSPCDLVDVCKQPNPDDPMCCTETAYCTPMGLVVDRSCNPDCSTCFDDTGCAPGAAICVGGTCTPCPPPINCAPCPMGWEPLRRNGCETCDCAPVTECKIDRSDPMAPASMCVDPNEVCYPGERCTAGCAPSDDCCANVCAAPGCPEPAPLGCLVACSDPNCMQCAAEACECVNGTWQCAERCVDGSGVTASCFIAP